MGDGYHVALYRLNLADPLGRIQLVNDLQKRPRVHTALATDSVLAVFFAHLVENPVDKENRISCQQIGKKTCWIPVTTCREKSPCQQIGKKTCWIPVITCREKISMSTNWQENMLDTGHNMSREISMSTNWQEN